MLRQALGARGSSNPYLYAATSGYRNDGDAGLSHVGARYYDAQVGRFISRDTYLDQKPYLYCEHNPVNNLDPSGHIIVTWAKPAPYSDWDPTGWNYNFNGGDWNQIANGVDQIGTAEMTLGGILGIPSMIGAGSPNPGQVVPGVPPGWSLPGFPKPAPGAGVAKPGGIVGAIGGGLMAGGAIAKFILAPIIRNF